MRAYSNTMFTDYEGCVFMLTRGLYKHYGVVEAVRGAVASANRSGVYYIPFSSLSTHWANKVIAEYDRLSAAGSLTDESKIV